MKEKLKILIFKLILILISIYILMILFFYFTTNSLTKNIILDESFFYNYEKDYIKIINQVQKINPINEQNTKWRFYISKDKKWKYFFNKEDLIINNDKNIYEYMNKIWIINIFHWENWDIDFKFESSKQFLRFRPEWINVNLFINVLDKESELYIDKLNIEEINKYWGYSKINFDYKTNGYFYKILNKNWAIMYY